MKNQKFDLLNLARLAMISHGLEPDFSEAVFEELRALEGAATGAGEGLPDLTHLPWCSIDNDDSRDLDQLTVTQPGAAAGETKVLVAIADVDALVTLNQAIDLHAKRNTTTVYTGVKTFSMLPELLSTELTSLAEGQVRVAMVVEMNVTTTGAVTGSRIYRALVRNQAQLTYSGVSDWLENGAQIPPKAAKIAGLDEQLRTQDRLAQKMKLLRHQNGALDLETIEPRAVIIDGEVIDLKHEKKNRARELIEDFMIAVNGVTARFLTQAGYPALRRVVRTPARWDRIVEVASSYGETLPSQADATALAKFLSRQRSKDPLHFPDLSLTVVKLLGRGEYILQQPRSESVGHFGLAVRDYTHSTAPNRRFPDLITQRLLKAAVSSAPSPYSDGELSFLATHCTTQENAADKVERQIRKSASALLMSSRIGEHFKGIVTGASDKGTWARVLHPPVEGRLISGQRGLDVGDSVELKLLSTNVERGFIDFGRVGH